MWSILGKDENLMRMRIWPPSLKYKLLHLNCTIVSRPTSAAVFEKQTKKTQWSNQRQWDSVSTVIRLSACTCSIIALPTQSCLPNASSSFYVDTVNILCLFSCTGSYYLEWSAFTVPAAQWNSRDKVRDVSCLKTCPAPTLPQKQTTASYFLLNFNCISCLTAHVSPH